MMIGLVSSADKNSKRTPKTNDLPRKRRSPKSEDDRAALIGDKRDDENLIIAQLHVAFLRAHNAIASQGNTFYDARKILRRHYQWILPRMLIVEAVPVP